VVIAAVVFGAVALVTYDARSARSMALQDTLFYAACYGINEVTAAMPNQPAAWPVLNGSSITLSDPQSGVSPATTSGTFGQMNFVPGGFVYTPNPGSGTTSTIDVTVMASPVPGGYWYFQATSTSGGWGGQSRTVEALVEAQSFANYAIASGINGAPVAEMRFTNDQTVSGPVQFDGHFAINGHPQFNNHVSSANLDEIPGYTPGESNTPCATTAAANFPFANKAACVCCHSKVKPTYSLGDIPCVSSNTIITDTSHFYHPVSFTGCGFTNSACFTCNRPQMNAPAPPVCCPKGVCWFNGGQPPLQQSFGKNSNDFSVGLSNIENQVGYSAAFPSTYPSGNSVVTVASPNLAIIRDSPSPSLTPPVVTAVIGYPSPNTVAFFDPTGTPGTTGYNPTASPIAVVTTDGSNGAVVYVEGADVHVQGTLNGQLTLGVGPNPGNNAMGGDISIDGNLLYHQTFCTVCSSHNSDSLGLVAAYNINIDAWTSQAQHYAPNGCAHQTCATGTPSGLTVDGALMAIDGTVQITCYNGSSSLNGTPYVGRPCFPKECSCGKSFQLNGSLINAYPSNKGKVSGSGSLQHGYLSNYFYDPRFQSSPPPFFPTTGQVTIRCFKDDGALSF
jgi:hypothetical protein